MSEDPVEFITGCPIVTCSRANNANDPCHWTHEKCGSYETIDNEGMIRCKKCGKLGCFVELQYKCRLHDNFHEPKTEQEFSAMLSVISSLPGVSRGFTRNLMKIVLDKCK